MSRSFWKVMPSMSRAEVGGPGQALAAAAFFVPAYFLLKRSTRRPRPAALLAGEERMAAGADLQAQLLLRGRVVQVAPQAQWTLTTWYSGWIPAFMALPGPR